MGIINRDGALWMATGVDNSGLYSGLNQAEGRIDQFGNHISALGDKITKLTGIGFGVAGLKAFSSEIINVRGEIQMLESSFEVLLGGKGVSGFMSEMKQFAVDSPLSMNGVANAAQTLLGFGIAAEKVMPTIKQIGDISMGNEERFKSLSLAFAQMSATGKLMGQDLLQMINAGFNPLQVISEKTGKSIGELKKEMESGAISSEMVADAFASATKKGGKFYGMTQKQAEGIRGLQAQLEGGLQDAFNEIGKSQEGLIAGGYKVATALVENYRLVGEALTALIATYGVYKAAMVFNTSIDKTVTVMRYEAEIAELTKLLPLKEQEANADLKTAVASGKLTQAKAEQLIALRAEIQSKLEVIKANQATAISDLEAATASHKAALQRALASKAMVSQRQMELSLAKLGGDAAQIELAQKSLLQAQEERHIAVKARKASADTLAISRSQANAASVAVETMQTSINTATQNANTVSTNVLTAAKTRLITVAKNLWAVLAPNPYILAAAAAVALGYGVYKLATRTTELEQAQKRVNSATKDFQGEVASERAQIDILFGRLKSAKEGTEKYQKVKDEIISKYGKYLEGLNAETKSLHNVAEAYKAITENATKAAKARALESSIENSAKAFGESYSENITKIQDAFIRKYGNERGTKLFSKLQDQIDAGLNTNQMSEDVQAAISLWDDVITSEGSGYARTVNFIESRVDAISNSRKVFEEENKRLNNVFDNILKIDDKGKDSVAPKIYGADYKAAEKEWKEAKAALSKIEKDRDDFTSDEYKKAKDREKTAKEAFESWGGKTKDTSNAEESAAEKARKTAQKVLDDQLKLDNDKAKASLDARNQELENQQALLNLQEDGFEKEQKQAEINHQKELLSIDKRAQELIEAKQKAERDAWDIKNPNPKTTYVNKTVSSSDLLLGQQSELNNSRDIANRTQIKANADLLKNLLEKYQDFNTKKIAVDKQYNKDLQALESQRTNDNSESINRSISQLKKQYEESISAINIEELRESIDWQTVFGNIDRVSSQSIENLRSKLKEYASEAGKNLAPTDMKTLTDAIDQLDKKYAELKPNKAFTDSFNDYKAATDNVKRLRQELEVIKSGGNITIGAEYDKESGKMTTVVKTQTQAEKDLTDAQNKRRQSLISLGTALQGYVSKSQQYLDLANETVSTLESFGVKVPEGVSKTLEGLGQISSGMDDVSKGLTSMNPVLIAQGGIKALGGLANAVQGIFGKRNKAADDTKRLQDVTEKVSVANDAINSLLEKRIELIKESTAAERQHLSVLTNESLDAYQDYYDEQFNRLLGNDLYGKKGKNNNLSVEDVMKMYGLSSPEDFAKWWQSGGYGALTLQGYDLRDKDKYDSWASAYMDMIDKRKELAQTMDEEATQISFDSFRDSFLDTLSDMDSSSKDFAENFEGYLQKAMLNSLLNEKYQDRIKNLYSMFSDYNADGNIDESEYKKLQDYEKQLTDDMIADRDKLKKSFGWDSSTSQSSSYGTSTSMDQETGGAILGRLTGVHETSINIEGNTLEIILLMSKMNQLGGNNNQELQAIKNSTVQSMFYLEEIRDSVNELPEIKSLLVDIKKNTNAFKGK